MTVLVYVVGALLVLAGAVFISMGVPIVRLEIGWSEIIGGAVAGSAGFIVLALGVVVARLEDLRRAVLGMTVTAALRDSFGEPEPAWEAPPEKSFAPHPLAPVPVPPQPSAAAPFELPFAEAAGEPKVEPEPPLAEAPLHPREPEPLEDLIEDLPPLRASVEPSRAPSLAEGAPALQVDEAAAPPLPPIEAVPPDTLAEVEPEPEAEPPTPPVLATPPLAPRAPAAPVSSDAARTRPNFLATFLARRSAAGSLVGRMTPPRERSPVEPTLMPLRQLEGGEPPARTSIDLSSGWGDLEPPHRAPSGPIEETVPPAPAPSVGEHEIGPPDRVEDEPVAEPPIAPEPVPTPVSVVPEPPPAVEDEPAAEPEPLKPVVVGRYNAGSASYIMYSNGMIEVETESGTHQFASMQDLKSFIERRDAAKV